MDGESHRGLARSRRALSEEQVTFLSEEGARSPRLAARERERESSGACWQQVASCDGN